MHESENNGFGVMRSRHFHFSKAAPVDTKTIYQQRGGRARRGLEDFSVTELRAVRWVIPGNEREEGGGGRMVEGLTASAEALEEPKVSDWNSDLDPLFLFVYRNPQRLAAAQ